MMVRLLHNAFFQNHIGVKRSFAGGNTRKTFLALLVERIFIDRFLPKTFGFVPFAYGAVFFPDLRLVWIVCAAPPSG